jgi:hypothetical protein
LESIWELPTDVKVTIIDKTLGIPPSTSEALITDAFNPEALNLDVSTRVVINAKE